MIALFYIRDSLHNQPILTGFATGPTFVWRMVAYISLVIAETLLARSWECRYNTKVLRNVMGTMVFVLFLFFDGILHLVIPGTTIAVSIYIIVTAVSCILLLFRRLDYMKGLEIIY